MAVIAKLRHLRIAPRKTRLVADLIRKKKVGEAQTILSFTVKGAVLPLQKLLKSAISNAVNNLRLSEDNLYIQKITVDEGPKYKRWMPRARGQAYEIKKRTSNITIVLDEIKKPPLKEASLAQTKLGGGRKKAGDRGKSEIKRAIEEVKREKISQKEAPKFKPVLETKKTKTEKGLKRIFRRKAFG